MNFKRKMVLFIATSGYVGKIPFAPGTFGSAVGVIVYFLLTLMPVSMAALAAVGLILIAVWASELAEKLLEKKDPGCVVIDEVAGMVVTMIGLPFNAVTVISGFILFRVLDILKPPPIRALQEGLQGGGGVVMDDVAAGIIGNVGLRCFFLIFLN